MSLYITYYVHGTTTDNEQHKATGWNHGVLSAPQLALEVICNGKTLDEAIDTDWRNTKAWQPGWDYVVEQV
jgi:hypothetical protein